VAQVQRRLAAILAADVVGYSRLTAANEAGTLAQLRRLRAEVIDPKIVEYQGLIVGSAGDSLLVEFASAVNAVQCAVELQAALADGNAALPDDRRMAFRMGVNLGDVIAGDGTIHGDGVNIASRLEKLAPPGTVCIGRSIHEQVKSKLPYDYADLGDQRFHNIPEPVHAFRVIGLALSESVPVGAGKVASPPAGKPSIAVLPFTNLSADTEQEFFADGLTEDLITELSKAPGLFVIARHSCFAFKNKSVDVRHVAQELGVRYILEGSARRAGARIRINAQLIDAREGGSHLWADRFDRDLADVFAVQDEVVACIVEALVGKLAARKLPERKPPRSLEAYDLCVRGRLLSRRQMAEEGKEARRLFEQAVALDPDYAEAHAHLAWAHWMGWVNWFEPADPHRRLALEIARRAVAPDPNDAWAHTVLGFVLQYELEYEASAAELETALRLDPNQADTYALRTGLLVMEGRPLEAIASATQALRLNPYPLPLYYWGKGEAEYAARQYENAVATLRHEATYGTPSRAMLAAALAQLGRIEEASIEGRLFMADYPSFTIKSFLDTQPFRNKADRAHFAEGYRKAGLPE
jgi:TolB-like protein/class 3 adenylate cyclase/tetratricopeptide (TPR) repeat protein